MGSGDPGDGEPAGESAGQPGARTRRRWTVLGRTLVLLAVTVLLVGAGVAYVIVRRAEDGLAAREINALVPDDPNIVRPSPSGSDPGTGADGATAPDGSTTAADIGAPAVGTPENILVLGLDTRPPEDAATTGGTSQSDVIMIAHVSGDRQRVDVLSIPRDTRVAAPTCKEWDYSRGALSDHDFPNTYAYWKITNAYAVGGPQCTVRAVQALTGLQIHRVIVIDFDGFKSIVDAMGGIQMTFAGPVVDAGVTVVDRAGAQLVNGDQALKLVRARHVAGDPSGDLGRIGRQQQVLTAMLAQAVSSGLLIDPVRLDRTMQAVVENTATDNVSFEDLVGLAQSLQGNGTGDIGLHTLPTAPDPGSEFLLPAVGDEAIFTALVNDQAYPVAPGS